MPLLQNVLLCALAALVLCTLLGLPLARYFLGDRALAAAAAPIAGWAVFSTLALPILTASGFTWFATAAVSVAVVLCGAAMLLRSRSNPAQRAGTSVPPWALAAAALLAVVPALSTWPKLEDGGLVLAESMFDHSKIAMIDDMMRHGLPPGNPFFGEIGHPAGLAYYYLWHFGAALFGLLTRASGWEADVALTWFTAFASLALMMGVAVWLSGRRMAAPLALLLVLAGSLRPVLAFALPGEFLARALSDYQPMKSWMFQADWVPQHLASASCVLLAVLLMARLASSPRWQPVPLLSLVVAAGFESSTWIGGVIFAVGAAVVVAWLLGTAPDRRSRVDFLIKLAAAAFLVVAVAFPFLRDEYLATAARQVGFPIALTPFPVLGTLVSERLRHTMDLPAYWLILLVIEFPAIYLAGVAAIASTRSRAIFRADRRQWVALALLALASFAIPWLFASTIANNDLGWRGVLPGILTLTAFAAAGLAHWLATARRAAFAVLVMLALGLPNGLSIARDNAVGTPMPSAAAFARSQELWAAVRRHAAPDERVGNNPEFLRDSVRWPVNMSWALFAGRRSCYAGWELMRAYVALPQREIDRIDTLFKRVFAGEGTAEDVQALATRYDCRVVVVAPSDGAWSRDPFADGSYYRLVEQREGKWRIYRAIERP